MGTFQDAQDLGISIEVLPLSRPDDDFNMSTFYAVSDAYELFTCIYMHVPIYISFSFSYVQDLLGLEGKELAEFKALVGERFEFKYFLPNFPVCPNLYVEEEISKLYLCFGVL